MTVAGAATAFITGADGFVGTTLIRVLRSAGATAVIGDLLPAVQRARIREQEVDAVLV